MLYRKYVVLVLCSLCALAGNTLAEDRFFFDDNPLSTESHWGGAGSGETGFTSGAWYFPHNDGTYSWDGFVYSNETDTTTPGYTNQFSAVTGRGVNGSANYGIGYIPCDWMSGTYDPIPQNILATGTAHNAVCEGFYVTNTTYAYLAMRDGEGGARKFGGDTGDDPDYFKLIIKGVDGQGQSTGTVEVYLADYRFTDNSEDYIIDEWTWVNTSSLGSVAGLEFVLESSDVGTYGINTPTYFAVDNVPEPATISLLVVGGLAMLRRRKK
jgi:hypothetical protein